MRGLRLTCGTSGNQTQYPTDNTMVVCRPEVSVSAMYLRRYLQGQPARHQQPALGVMTAARAPVGHAVVT
jgi:hypothetical protein